MLIHKLYCTRYYLSNCIP